MKAVIVTAPIIEPVSVAEVKNHLRVSTNDDDALIASLIKSCREQVEQSTNRAIMTQTWDYFRDTCPSETAMTLPFGKLQSVTSVKWKDTDGSETTLVVSTDYYVELNGERHGRIVLPYGVSWPTSVLYPSNPISVRLVCGWTTQELVPYRIKQAIMMLCAAQYEDRGEAIVGLTRIWNKTVDSLLFNERLWGGF